MSILNIRMRPSDYLSAGVETRWYLHSLFPKYIPETIAYHLGFYNTFDRWNFAFYEKYIPFLLMIDTNQAIGQSDAGIIIHIHLLFS